MKELLKAILAGMIIGVGGAIYLAMENHVVGAVLFCIGLLVIYMFGWNLYTGKVCYISERPLSYLKLVGISFIGNWIGALGTGYLFRITKLSRLVPVAEQVAGGKLADNYFSAFIMAIGCGLMIYVAVVGYETIADFGRYFVLILPIVVFTLVGFEHVVADMFYFSMANVWDLHACIYTLVVALGNMVGGMMVPVLKKVYEIKK